MKNNDGIFMQRAIMLALKGKGYTAPNPMVGCVITIDDPDSSFGKKIIGEGYHQMYGGPHAEVNAIASVKDKSLLKEASIYVTLEPCAHFGKTPPCADLIVAHQIPRAVIGATDPFVKVAGKGIDKLKKSGVEVVKGIYEEECRVLNRRFFTFHLKKRPYIVLKFAETADGFIAKKDFNSKWISNQSSRMLVHKYRSEESAIMTGTNTAVYDNPKLDVREWTGENPVRCIIDRALRVPTSHYVFDNSIKTYVFNEVKEGSTGNTTYLKVNFNNSFLQQVMNHLYNLNLMSVLVEGGSFLLKKLMAEGLWDEARVFSSPEMFGDGIPAPALQIDPTWEHHISNNELKIYFNPENEVGGIKIENPPAGFFF